jgi:dipeptidase E
MQQSGVAELLPSLRAVYVGLSAGSMVMTPNIGEYFAQWTPPTNGNVSSNSAVGADVEGKDQTLGLVDFAIFPHLDNEDMRPHNSMADAEKWAARMRVPGYAIDDQTAIKVVDGAVEVVSEGHWKLFTP